VAFTVTTVRESENKRHNEVWVAPVAGGDATRYTSPSTESSNPRFSADGKYLLFNSTRQGSKARTWALRMDQPGGEAMEMNDYPNGSLPRDKSMAVWSEPSRRIRRLTRRVAAIRFPQCSQWRGRPTARSRSRSTPNDSMDAMSTNASQGERPGIHSRTA
jgi:dipeptidyl aminopeptidase/acylaminoacyl peptidase